MAKARLETEITGDHSPFVRSVEEAEKRAQTFQGRITQLFRRDPGMRAEHALSGFITDLTAGNIPGAIESIASKVGGLGLAAGVGFGALSAIAVKASEQIEAVDKSVGKLNQDLSRPLSVQAALGPEGISQEIERTKKDLDDVVEKRKGIFERIREAWQRGERSSYEMFADTSQAPDREPAAAKAQAAAQERIRRLVDEQANAELKVAEAKRISIQVSEREGGLLKQALEYEKSRAQVILDSAPNRPGRDQSVFFKRLAAVEETNRTSRTQIEQDAAARERAVEHERRLLDAQGSSSDVQQQKIAAARENVSQAETELALQTNITKEKRAQLELDLRRAQATLAQAERDARLALGRHFQPLLEKSQLSLEELANQGVTGRPGLDRASYLARQAQREESIGETERRMGHTDEAFKHFFQAEQIKSQIPQLKESEKDPGVALVNALNVTVVPLLVDVKEAVNSLTNAIK